MPGTYPRGAQGDGRGTEWQKQGQGTTQAPAVRPQVEPGGRVLACPR